MMTKLANPSVVLICWRSPSKPSVGNDHQDRSVQCDCVEKDLVKTHTQGIKWEVIAHTRGHCGQSSFIDRYEGSVKPSPTSFGYLNHMKNICVREPSLP